MEQVEDVNGAEVANGTDSATYEIVDVLSVTQSVSEGTYFVDVSYIGPAGAEHATAQAVSATDPYGVNPTLWQWLMDHEGEYVVQPYVPPPPLPYTIAVSEVWNRMTDEEAEAFDMAMSTASPLRLRRAFTSASALTSQTELFNFATQVFAGAVSQARAAVVFAQN